VLYLVPTDLPDFHAECGLPPPVILAQESNLDAAHRTRLRGRFPPTSTLDIL
jgi:hypothetical protein